MFLYHDKAAFSWLFWKILCKYPWESGQDFTSMFPGTIQYFLISNFCDWGFCLSSGHAYPYKVMWSLRNSHLFFWSLNHYSLKSFRSLSAPARCSSDVLWKQMKSSKYVRMFKILKMWLRSASAFWKVPHALTIWKAF